MRDYGDEQFSLICFSAVYSEERHNGTHRCYPLLWPCHLWFGFCGELGRAWGESLELRFRWKAVEG